MSLMVTAYTHSKKKHEEEKEGLRKSVKLRRNTGSLTSQMLQTSGTDVRETLTTVAELAAFVSSDKRIDIIIMQTPKAAEPHIIGLLLPTLSKKNVG